MPLGNTKYYILQSVKIIIKNICLWGQLESEMDYRGGRVCAGGSVLGLDFSGVFCVMKVECGRLLLQLLLNLIQTAGVQRCTRYKLLALRLIGICLQVALLEPILDILYTRRIDIAATP